MLVADDDATIRSACEEVVRTLGYAAESTDNRQAARTLACAHLVDILLLNVPPGDPECLELVSEVRTLCPQGRHYRNDDLRNLELDHRCDASRRIRLFGEAFQGGRAFRCPRTRRNDLSSVAGVRLLREGLHPALGFGSMIGHSVAMEKLYRILSKVAESAHPVLILGESGTGKELVAQTIHNNGPNSKKPFLPVDCGSLVPTLIESELFGHVKGAFTGANRCKDGLLVSAETGTVFLDEIGELPLDLQAKLLRALQEKEVRPVGANHAVPIKARILAATNRDLAAMVENGSFRKDLFYRLNVVNLRLPPLRTRREDILPLTAHFLERISRESGKRFTLSDDAHDDAARVAR